MNYPAFLCSYSVPKILNSYNLKNYLHSKINEQCFWEKQRIKSGFMLRHPQYIIEICEYF